MNAILRLRSGRSATIRLVLATALVASGCRAPAQTSPALTQQPASQTNLVGSNAALNVTATGDSVVSTNIARLSIPDPAAVELVRAIERAYRGIQTCEIRQELQVRDPDTGKEQPGGWRRCLAFDRGRASFREDHWFGESSTPTVVAVCNGRKLWHRDLRPLYSSFVGKDGKEDRTESSRTGAALRPPAKELLRLTYKQHSTNEYGHSTND